MWVTETHDRATYYQRAANLSAGGIYLDGTIPHPRGTIVTLQFTLPGESEAISCRGIVVGDPNEDHLGMHLMFVDIADHKVRRRLSRYLAATGAKPDDGGR
jgi:hypothetical protein